MNATKYVDILTDLANDVVFLLPSDTVEICGIFEVAISFESWIIDMLKVALRLGSSKHGNAVRAYVGSNFVDDNSLQLRK